MSTELNDLLTIATEAHEKEEYTNEIGLLEEALAYTTNAMEKASILEKIGNGYYLLDRSQDAKNRYLSVLGILSELDETEKKERMCSVSNRLGAVFFDEDNYREALSWKLKALECIDSLDLKNAFLLLVTIGVNNEKLGNYDEAAVFYHRALSTKGIEESDIAMVNKFLGQCYDKLGEKQKAFEYYNKTLTIDPNYDSDWYFFYRVAELAYELNDYKVSKEFFLKTLEWLPSSERAYLKGCHKYLGFIHLAEGKYRDVLSEFKQLLKTEPDTSAWRGVIYVGMAQAYFSMGRPRSAINYARKALTEELNDIFKEKIDFILAKAYLLLSRSGTSYIPPVK